MIKIADAKRIVNSCYSDKTTGVILYELPFSMIIGNNVLEKDTLALVPFETQYYNTFGHATYRSVSPLFPIFFTEETDTGYCFSIWQSPNSKYYPFIPTSCIRFPTKRFNDDGTQVTFVWASGNRREQDNGVTSYNITRLPLAVRFSNSFFSDLKPISISPFPQHGHSYGYFGTRTALGVFEYNGDYYHIVSMYGTTEQNDYPQVRIDLVIENDSSISYKDLYSSNEASAGVLPLTYDGVTNKFYCIYPRDTALRLVTIDIANQSSSNKDISIPTKRVFLPAILPTDTQNVFYFAYVDNDSGNLKLSRLGFDPVNVNLTETVVDSGLPEVASALSAGSFTVVRLEKFSLGSEKRYLLFVESRLKGTGEILSDKNSNGDSIAKIWVYKENNGTLEKVGELDTSGMIRTIVFSKDKTSAVFGTANGTFLLHQDSSSATGIGISFLSTVVPVAIGRDEYDRFWILDVASELYLYSPVLPFKVDVSLDFPTNYINEGETVTGSVKVSVYNAKGERMVATVRLVSANPDVALLGDENKQTLDVTTSTTDDVVIPVTVYRRGKVRIDSYLLSVNLGG